MVNRGWIVSNSVTVSNLRSDSTSNAEFNSDPVIGVYTISVASDLISMHPNTLRNMIKTV